MIFTAQERHLDHRHRRALRHQQHLARRRHHSHGHAHEKPRRKHHASHHKKRVRARPNRKHQENKPKRQHRISRYKKHIRNKLNKKLEENDVERLANRRRWARKQLEITRARRFEEAQDRREQLEIAEKKREAVGEKAAAKVEAQRRKKEKADARLKSLPKRPPPLDPPTTPAPNSEFVPDVRELQALSPAPFPLITPPSGATEIRFTVMYGGGGLG